MIHYNITVKGKVQGVWFRKYTFDKANEMQLKGFVQNQPNRDVYIEIEDTNEVKLQSFITWLYTGSPMSKVSEVLVNKTKNIIGFNNFIIRQ